MVRLFLIALSLAGMIFMLYIFFDERGTRWLTGAYAAGLALNAVYLVTGEPKGLRLFKLIALWFDAKEAELRTRARRD